MEYFSRFTALLLLVILSPFILFVIILLFLTQGQPIFFHQTRVGFKYKNFKLIKFRTMHNNNDNNMITILHDPRITRIGKLLRYLKIDEVPQLINIIQGHMRFIGPRPEVPFYVNENFNFLNNIKPGISDFSSIIFRNEEKILQQIKNKHAYKEVLLPLKIELGNYYSIKKSFFLDLLLVMLTLLSIFFPKLTIKMILIMIIDAYNPKLSNKIKQIVK